MELGVEFKRDVSFKGAHSLGVGIWGSWGPRRLELGALLGLRG